MTLISKAAAYDTFLANTRGGALYTIHIPVNNAMKPVGHQGPRRHLAGLRHTGRRPVPQLRNRCRRQRQGHQVRLYLHLRRRQRPGNLDHQPRQGPGTFTDPTYFRFTPPVKSDWLFGE
ncbi:hypothetical protein [Kribbella sp. NPDC000426]|uniref:hypothetical protein n=1 Tax=Kribbella sp. NPDC000426 TaxID=3154255 RepID=UPI00331AFF79